ncbi:tetratricopeptide repeat protein 23 [Plakobranchus ocellatus]|uniref:Tetratricopeptide repeat protein 23 n=1 Tax=Plakobranchus ocellatus TaxID=259542 RepID=A0AAV3XUS6_9GAST|nr:tetratricopeptide repeat protein 23 [Plakobranchus ocellatus]
MVGDDEQVEGDVAPTVPIVEISRRGDRSRVRDEHEDHEDYSDDADFDEEDEDDVALPSPRRTSPSPRSLPATARHKSVNGRRKVDMTPPDVKLEKSQELAKRFSSEGKIDKAMEEFIKCVAFSRIVNGSSHWRHALAIINLGEAYLDLKGYNAQAEYHGETARSIMLHGGHTAASMEEKAELYAVLIKIYRIIGQAATGLKKYPEAEQALQKADKISQERSRLTCVTDRECDQLDIALFSAMARLYGKQKKYALASEKYDKLTELMEKEYGTDSSQVMKTYTEYGKLELSKGRHANFDKAINLFLQAHSIASAIHKEGHPELIDTALALSQAYASTGWEEAEASALSYLEECVSTCTSIYGPNNPKTLEVNDHLAKMMVRMDKSQDAMQILRSSLPLKSEVFGDYSEPVSDTYKLMGSISLSEGSIEKALRAYKKCHTIEVILLGKNHRKTKDTLQTMEMLMSSPGLSHKFVLNKADELQKRPRFNSVVGRTK